MDLLTPFLLSGGQYLLRQCLRSAPGKATPEYLKKRWAIYCKGTRDSYRSFTITDAARFLNEEEVSTD